MTVDPNSIDLPAFMAEHLQRAEPELLRSMLSTFVQALMSAEADAICGASYGERSPERSNSRNGIRCTSSGPCRRSRPAGERLTATPAPEELGEHLVPDGIPMREACALIDPAFQVEIEADAVVP